MFYDNAPFSLRTTSCRLKARDFRSQRETIKNDVGLRPDLIYEPISFYEVVKVEVRYWTIAVAAMVAVSRRRILEPRLIA